MRAVIFPARCLSPTLAEMIVRGQLRARRHEAMRRVPLITAADAAGLGPVIFRLVDDGVGRVCGGPVVFRAVAIATTTSAPVASVTRRALWRGAGRPFL